MTEMKRILKHVTPRSLFVIQEEYVGAIKAMLLTNAGMEQQKALAPLDKSAMLTAVVEVSRSMQITKI